MERNNHPNNNNSSILHQNNLYSTQQYLTSNAPASPFVNYDFYSTFNGGAITGTDNAANDLFDDMDLQDWMEPNHSSNKPL